MAGGKSRLLRLIKKKSFLPIIGMDAVNVLLMGANMYRVNYAENIRRGMTEEKAKQTALDDMMAAIELTQQGGSVLNMAQWQRRGGAIGKMVGMFTTQPMLFMAYEIEAFRRARKQNTKAAWGYAAWIFAVNHIILPGAYTLAKTLFNWAFGDEPDEDDLTWIITNMLIGPFAGFYLFGMVISGLAEGATGTRRFNSESVPTMEITRLAYNMAKTGYDLFTDQDKLWSDIDRLIKSIAPAYRHGRKIYENYLD